MTPIRDDLGYRERFYNSSDGLRLYFRDYGDPLSSLTPVLCLPGLTRNCKDFHQLALRLSLRRRVICPDLRGRGRSQYDDDWKHYLPATYLEDLRHLLAVCNVEKVVVVGVSMGGVLGMAIAVTSPCVLSGIILNDIGPELDPRGIRRIAGYMREYTPQTNWLRTIDFLKEAFPRMSDQSDQGWQEMAENTFRECEDGILRFDWDPGISKALSTLHFDINYWPIFRALKRLPVLAIRGSESDILSNDTFARMATELSEYRHITIEGVGHTPNLREPESLAAIDKFLAEIH